MSVGFILHTSYIRLENFVCHEHFELSFGRVWGSHLMSGAELERPVLWY